MTQHSVVTRFRLAPTGSGFRIVLEPGSDDRLLRKLFDDDPRMLSCVLPGALPFAIGHLMVEASRRGLELQPKGRLTDPLLVLTEVQRLPPSEGAAHPFAELPGKYAAHWGLTDFYDENAAALKQALSGSRPFDTGIFGCKKEIHYGRVWRESIAGPTHVWVKCEGDDGVALADTALWKAFGGNDKCDSGEGALRQLGIPEDQLWEVLASLAKEAGVGEENSAERSLPLPSTASFEAVCEALESLVSLAEQELDDRYKALLQVATAYLHRRTSGQGE